MYISGGGAPTLHKTQHQNGGTDQVSVAGLLGVLANEQASSWAAVSGKPSTFAPSAHKTSHQLAGSDQLDLTGLTGKVNLTNRGDAAGWDFTVANFTTDGNDHDLDLSAIVPTGAKWVKILARVVDETVGNVVWFFAKGETHRYNMIGQEVQVNGRTINIIGDVPLDANRKISYYTSNTTFTAINFLVRGWYS